MPTNRPNVNFVVSNGLTEKVIRAGLDDLADLNRSSMSGEIERILIETLLTTDPSVRGIMADVYAGQRTVRGVLASEFSDASAHIGWERYGGPEVMQPLVEFVSRLSVSSMVDMATPDGMGGQVVYHAHSCWESVVNMLKRNIENEQGERDLGVALDADEAEQRLSRLVPDGKPIDASGFYSIVLRNWGLLGGYDYTYRALMDLVRMSNPLREDARARYDLKEALLASYSLRGEKS